MVRVVLEATQDNRKEKENTFIRQNKEILILTSGRLQTPPLRPQRVELIA